MRGTKTLHLLLVFLLMLGLAAFTTGCKKSDSTSPETGGVTGPSIPTPPTLKGPNTTSTNANVIQAKSNVSAANAYIANFSVMSAISAMPGTAGANNTWTWTLNLGTATWAWSAAQNQNSSWYWKATLNGTSSGVTYSNWTAYDGTLSSDGKTGTWQFYNENAAVMAGKLIYQTAASGTVTASVISYSTGVMTYHADITNNTDNSGEVDVYGGTAVNVLILKVAWISAGSGTWITYDSSTGVQNGTGTWN